MLWKITIEVIKKSTPKLLFLIEKKKDSDGWDKKIHFENQILAKDIAF